MRNERVAVVTGASAGIGAAVARVLARSGFHVVVTARRADPLAEVAMEIGGTAEIVDVTDSAAIDRFAATVRERFGRVDVLVNNAGLALGLEPLERSTDADWLPVWETNVLGVARVTRALLPLLRVPPHAHIVNLGSLSGIDVYVGGAAYTASKHALRAISKTLRLELNGEPIRVTELAPGMVETDFSVTRFGGDREKAAAVYAGITPLTAEDIADTIGFAVTRPPHVNIDFLIITPVAQAALTTVARKS